ncbi:hypothetical protein JXJ21_24770 [candidate division KSB1 bacterium]|nr:hypothetical protein [candidate division KSB1 bacterium]
MKKIKAIAFLKMFIILLVLIRCSQENPVEPIESYLPPPEFPFFDLVLPESFIQSKDTMAQKAVFYLNHANSINEYRELFLTPDSTTTFARRSEMDAWASVRRLDTLTIYVHIARHQDGQNAWLILLDGVYRGERIDSMNYLNAEHRPHEPGEIYEGFEFYILDRGGQHYQWTDYWFWRKLWPDLTMHIDTSVMNRKSYLSIIYRDDHSGSIEMWFPPEPERASYTIVVNWNADGSGTWEEYDHIKQLINSGYW